MPSTDSQIDRDLSKKWIADPLTGAIIGSLVFFSSLRSVRVVFPLQLTIIPIPAYYAR